MVTKKMSRERYESAVRALQKHARKEPFKAGYEVELQAGNALYRLTFLPYKGYRMAVLQALKITHDNYREEYGLISSGALLHALAEVWLSQVEEPCESPSA